MQQLRMETLEVLVTAYTIVLKIHSILDESSTAAVDSMHLVI